MARDNSTVDYNAKKGGRPTYRKLGCQQRLKGNCMFKQGYQTENRNTTWNKIVDITDLENLYGWTGKRLLLIVLWHLTNIQSCYINGNMKVTRILTGSSPMKLFHTSGRTNEI